LPSPSEYSLQVLPLTRLSHRGDLRGESRKMAENNRNWTLFSAQISFMVLARLYNDVPAVACEIFAIIIHLLYLAFFAWTGES